MVIGKIKIMGDIRNCIILIQGMGDRKNGPRQKYWITQSKLMLKGWDPDQLKKTAFKR